MKQNITGKLVKCQHPGCHEYFEPEEPGQAYCEWHDPRLGDFDAQAISDQTSVS